MVIVATFEPIVLYVVMAFAQDDEISNAGAKNVVMLKPKNADAC